MFAILLALHFLGLMMGAGGGFGSMIVMGAARTAAPDHASVLRGLGPSLARFSAIGLALMWITGLSMVLVRYGGFAALPTMFWVKMIFVGTLTLSAIATDISYAQAKAGNAAAAARLPVLGPMSGVSSILAVLFAALAFG